MRSRITSTLLLFTLTIPAFASHITTPKNLYVGLFGGGGSTSQFNANQYGTAYIVEASGGPLAVDAFGHLGGRSASFLGAQLGYPINGLNLSPSSRWTIMPAIELEGYAMSETTFQGDLINNTARVPEHDFKVSYPMSRNVFLGNAVLSFDHPSLLIQPYIGFGIGSALIRISGADATQISPPEAGINHYNGHADDTDSTFAGQIKIGLNYNINKNVSLFADYRWLYVGSTHFVFGSTIVTGHAATSSWEVIMDPQKSNLGNIGVRVNL